MKMLIDTDILLDVLTGGQRYEQAADVMDLVEAGVPGIEFCMHPNAIAEIMRVTDARKAVGVATFTYEERAAMLQDLKALLPICEDLGTHLSLSLVDF